MGSEAAGLSRVFLRDSSIAPPASLDGPPHPLTLILACACALPAAAQRRRPPPLDRRLAPPPPRIERDAVRFLSADRITGDEAKHVTATGNVSLRQRGAAISADRLEYSDVETDTARRHRQRAPRARRRHRDRPAPRLPDRRRHRRDGAARSSRSRRPRSAATPRAARPSARSSRATRRAACCDAEYTTCPVPRDDWLLKVSELEIDGKRQVGTAWNSAVYFFGVPILYSPWLSFPIDNARKTGFLAPTFGIVRPRAASSSRCPGTGTSPRTRTRPSRPRSSPSAGCRWAASTATCGRRYTGQADIEFLPNDAIADTDRYFVALRHSQQLPLGLSLAVNAQKVSDDDYFRDLSTRVAATSQTNLPRDVILGYQRRRVDRDGARHRLPDPAGPARPGDAALPAGAADLRHRAQAGRPRHRLARRRASTRTTATRTS